MLDFLADFISMFSNPFDQKNGWRIFVFALIVFLIVALIVWMTQAQ